MPTPDNRRTLYNTLTEDGYNNLGSYEDFSKRLDEPENARALYNTISKDGYNNLGTYEEFYERIKPQQPAVTAGQQPATTAQAATPAHGADAPSSKEADAGTLPAPPVNADGARPHAAAGKKPALPVSEAPAFTPVEEKNGRYRLFNRLGAQGVQYTDKRTGKAITADEFSSLLDTNPYFGYQMYDDLSAAGLVSGDRLSYLGDVYDGKWEERRRKYDEMLSAIGQRQKPVGKVAGMGAARFTPVAEKRAGDWLWNAIGGAGLMLYEPGTRKEMTPETLRAAMRSPDYTRSLFYSLKEQGKLPVDASTGKAYDLKGFMHKAYAGRVPAWDYSGSMPELHYSTPRLDPNGYEPAGSSPEVLDTGIEQNSLTGMKLQFDPLGTSSPSTGIKLLQNDMSSFNQRLYLVNGKAVMCSPYEDPQRVLATRAIAAYNDDLHNGGYARTIHALNEVNAGKKSPDAFLLAVSSANQSASNMAKVIKQKMDDAASEAADKPVSKQDIMMSAFPSTANVYLREYNERADKAGGLDAAMQMIEQHAGRQDMEDWYAQCGKLMGISGDAFKYYVYIPALVDKIRDEYVKQYEADGSADYIAQCFIDGSLALSLQRQLTHTDQQNALMAEAASRYKPSRAAYYGGMAAGIAAQTPEFVMSMLSGQGGTYLTFRGLTSLGLKRGAAAFLSGIAGSAVNFGTLKLFGEGGRQLKTGEADVSRLLIESGKGFAEGAAMSVIGSIIGVPFKYGSSALEKAGHTALSAGTSGLGWLASKAGAVATFVASDNLEFRLSGGLKEDFDWGRSWSDNAAMIAMFEVLHLGDYLKAGRQAYTRRFGTMSDDAASALLRVLKSEGVEVDTSKGARAGLARAIQESGVDAEGRNVALMKIWSAMYGRHSSGNIVTRSQMSELLSAAFGTGMEGGRVVGCERIEGKDGSQRIYTIDENGMWDDSRSFTTREDCEAYIRSHEAEWEENSRLVMEQRIEAASRAALAFDELMNVSRQHGLDPQALLAFSQEGKKSKDVKSTSFAAALADLERRLEKITTGNASDTLSSARTTVESGNGLPEGSLEAILQKPYSQRTADETRLVHAYNRQLDLGTYMESVRRTGLGSLRASDYARMYEEVASARRSLEATSQDWSDAERALLQRDMREIQAGLDGGVVAPEHMDAVGDYLNKCMTYEAARDGAGHDIKEQLRECVEERSRLVAEKEKRLSQHVPETGEALTEEQKAQMVMWRGRWDDQGRSGTGLIYEDADGVVTIEDDATGERLQLPADRVTEREETTYKAEMDAFTQQMSDRYTPQIQALEAGMKAVAAVAEGRWSDDFLDFTREDNRFPIRVGGYTVEAKVSGERQAEGTSEKLYTVELEDGTQVSMTRGQIRDAFLSSFGLRPQAADTASMGLQGRRAESLLSDVPGLFLEEGRTMEDEAKATGLPTFVLAQVDALGKAIGTRIRLVDYVDANGYEANGYYERDTNTLVVSARQLATGKSIAWIVGHELTHNMRATERTEEQRASLAALAQKVREAVGEDVWRAKVEATMKHYKGVYSDEKLRTTVEEETLADALGDVMDGGHVMTRLTDIVQPQEASTLLGALRGVKERIVGFLRRGKKDGVMQPERVMRNMDELERKLEDTVRTFMEKPEEPNPYEPEVPEDGPEPPAGGDGGAETTLHVADMVERAREEAVPYVEKELTPEAWREEFGERGEVETPVGVVRLGEHQYEKLEEKGRASQFGLIRPTLTAPDFIIEESDPQEGAERGSKLLFIKTFTKGDGTKYTHFESVTVQQDGREVVVSSHPIREKALEKKLEKGGILWNRFGNGSDASDVRQVVDGQEAQGPNPDGHGPKNPQSIPTGEGTENAAADQTKPQENTPMTLATAPKDGQGEPLWADIKPEDGWDVLLDICHDDTKRARAAGTEALDIARRRLRDVEKKKLTGKGGLIARERAREAQEAARKQAQAQVSYWENVLAEPNARIQRKEAEREAERKRQAEAEKAERERREEEERRRRETLDGVPEYGQDNPEDARRRGFVRHRGDRIDRQEERQATGGETSVKFAQEATAAGHYTLIEASELQPSHIQGERNPHHFVPEMQPKDRADAVSRDRAREIASHINPEEITAGVTAYTGAPVMNARGEVIQGNGRTDALREMYRNHPEQARIYKEYLKAHAADFGLTPEQVEAMESPILARQLDVDDKEAIRLGQYTSTDTESGGEERLRPKNLITRLGDRMGQFANILMNTNSTDASLSELIADNGVTALTWLNNVGLITTTQYNTAVRQSRSGDVTLTERAADDLRDLIYESAFQGAQTEFRTFYNALPEKAKRAILTTTYRDTLSPRSERFLPDLQRAVEAFYFMNGGDPKFAKAKTMDEAERAASAFVVQTQYDDITGEPYIPANRFTDYQIAIASGLRGSTQKALQLCLKRFYNNVQGCQEPEMFSTEPPHEVPLTEARATLIEELRESSKNHKSYSVTDAPRRDDESPLDFARRIENRRKLYSVDEETRERARSTVEAYTSEEKRRRAEEEREKALADINREMGAAYNALRKDLTEKRGAVQDKLDAMPDTKAIMNGKPFKDLNSAERRLVEKRKALEKEKKGLQEQLNKAEDTAREQVSKTHGKNSFHELEQSVSDALFFQDGEFNNTEWQSVGVLDVEDERVASWLLEHGWNGTDANVYATEAGFVSHWVNHHPDMTPQEYAIDMQRNYEAYDRIGVQPGQEQSLVFERKDKNGWYYSSVISVGSDGRLRYMTSYKNEGKKTPHPKLIEWGDVKESAGRRLPSDTAAKVSNTIDTAKPTARKDVLYSVTKEKEDKKLYWPDGTLKKETMYGEYLTCTVKTWYKNGQQSTEETTVPWGGYIGDRYKWDRNGRLLLEAHYDEFGLPVERYLEFYKNGKPMAERQYNKHDLTYEKRWTSNGQLVYEKNCTGFGTPTEVKEWYSNGQMRSVEEYEDGKTKVNKRWYESGQIQWEYRYAEGKAYDSKLWFEDGKLKEETHLNEAGNRVGDWCEWWNEDTPHYERHYNDEGKPVGVWREWNYGWLREEKNYDTGEGRIWNKDGKLRADEHYDADGEKDGLQRYYNDDGTTTEHEWKHGFRLTNKTTDKDGKEVNTLVATHSLSIDDLNKVIKHGGMPNPSVGITDSAIKISVGYGEVSLVLPTGLLDASTGRHQGTAITDSWSPTVPKGWDGPLDAISRSMNSHFLIGASGCMNEDVAAALSQPLLRTKEEIHGWKVNIGRGGRNRRKLLSAYEDAKRGLGLSAYRTAFNYKTSYADNVKALGKDAADKVEAFRDLTRNLMSEYLELKFTTPLYLRECVGAVVPEGTPRDVVDYLKGEGLRVAVYKSGEEEKVFHEATRQWQAERGDVLFSLTDDEMKRDDAPKPAPLRLQAGRRRDESPLDFARRLTERGEAHDVRYSLPNYHFSDAEYSDMRRKNDEYNSDLERLIAGSLPPGHVFRLGYPSRILTQAGISGHEIQMSARRLKEKSVQSNHVFDLSEMRDLCLNLQNPLAVFRSATHVGDHVIVTEMKHEGDTFVAALHFNARNQVESIRSVHPRTDTNIFGWIRDGLCDYVHPDIEKEWLGEVTQKYLRTRRSNSDGATEARRDANRVANIVRNLIAEDAEHRNSKNNFADNPRQGLKDFDLTTPEGRRDVRFSISERRKKDMRERISNKLTHMSEADVERSIREIELMGERQRAGGDPKTEKAALHWLLSGGLRLPEDGYKVDRAMEIINARRLDYQAYRSPQEVIDQNTDYKPKARPTDPDTVAEFTNKRVLKNGYTIYDVADSRAGQAAVRKVIDTHWGEDANPWCLAARNDGTIADAWNFWQKYNKQKRQIAFDEKGRLNAFRSGDREGETWWDRNDNPNEGFTHTETDEQGRTVESIISVEGAPRFQQMYRGDRVNGRYEAWNADGNLVRVENWKDGKRDGEQTSYYDNGQKKDVEHYKDGKLDGECVDYYENGQPENVIHYKDGKLDGERMTHDDDVLIVEHYKDDKRDGERVEYYDNGQKMSVAHYKDGLLDGEWVVYFENGQPEYVFHYKDGTMDGEVVYYYENGQKARVAYYKDGIPDGENIAYEEDGSVRSVQYYKDGVEVPAPSSSRVQYSITRDAIFSDKTKSRREKREAWGRFVDGAYGIISTFLSDGGMRLDRAGNPVDERGEYVFERVEKASDLTEDDFETPSRSVELQNVPASLRRALGAVGKRIAIKRSTFKKNGINHCEMDARESASVLNGALYRADVVGQSQPITRPNYRVAIRMGETNDVVVLDVESTKKDVEIVGWRGIAADGLERMKKQASKEDGHFLILDTHTEPAGALSALQAGLRSKDTEIIGTSDGSGEENIRYSVVHDAEEKRRLEEDEYVRVYRAAQLVDGRLYPPMSGRVGREWREPIVLGEWEKSEERPELADDKGYFKLDKGNGKSVPARYNPYFHTSPTPLNDQFAEAQTRPELVTLEVLVPRSDMESGYKAEKAKDAVGRKQWKAGAVQSQLSGTREVILSRYDKPLRVVPDAEVAAAIRPLLGEEPVTMPSNVVTPSLRHELERLGVPFVETDNRGRITQGEHEGETYGSVYGKKKGKMYSKTKEDGKEKAPSGAGVDGARGSQTGRRPAEADVKDQASWKRTAKVHGFLERLKGLYQNYKIKSTKKFIGNIADCFGMNRDGASHYKRITAENGREIVARISTHNAVVGNFDQRGEREGVSIVISRGRDYGLRGVGRANVKEYFYSRKALEQAEGQPLVSIIESMQEMLLTGEYVDRTGLAHEHEVKDGRVLYSVTEDGRRDDESALDYARRMDTARRVDDLRRDVRYSLVGEHGAKWLDDVDDIRKAREQTEKMMHEEKEAKARKAYADLVDVLRSMEATLEDAGAERMKNLAVAQQMASEDKDALAIKRATGWEQGRDGRWRYEMADLRPTAELVERIRKDAKKPRIEMRLGDVMTGDLLHAYIRLGDLRLVFDSRLKDCSGYYDGQQIVISTRGGWVDEILSEGYLPAELQETLAHEVQHFIQDREGFAEGGTGKTAKAYLHEYLKGLSDDMLTPEERRVKAYIATASPWDVYMSLAGEVEARSVEPRLYMTQEERRQTLARADEDRPRGEQIAMLFGKGVLSNMGSRYDHRVDTFRRNVPSEGLEGNKRKILDVFSDRSGRETIELTRPDGETVRLRLVRGREGGLGAKHAIFKHYGEEGENIAGRITAEEIMLLDEVVATGERTDAGGGRRMYTKRIGDVDVKVLTHPRNGFEELANVYTNRTGSKSSASMELNPSLAQKGSMQPEMEPELGGKGTTIIPTEQAVGGKNVQYSRTDDKDKTTRKLETLASDAEYIAKTLAYDPDQWLLDNDLYTLVSNRKTLPAAAYPLTAHVKNVLGLSGVSGSVGMGYLRGERSEVDIPRSRALSRMADTLADTLRPVWEHVRSRLPGSDKRNLAFVDEQLRLCDDTKRYYHDLAEGKDVWRDEPRTLFSLTEEPRREDESPLDFARRLTERAAVGRGVADFDLTTPEGRRDVRFSISERRKKDMRERISNKLTHMSEADVERSIREIELMGERQRAGGDPKTEKAALHWLLSGGLRLPEDSYKVDRAMEIINARRLDYQAYRSPQEVIDQNTDYKPKARPTDPDTVPEFTNKRTLRNGYTVYDVADSRAGQQAVRRVIDTHWGEDANPWCLAARRNGSIDRAWDMWQAYNRQKRQIAFDENGRLLAFRSDMKEGNTWWDREDMPDNALTTQHEDKEGRTITRSYDTDNDREAEIVRITRGDRNDGVYEEWFADTPEQLSLIEERKDGKPEGLWAEYKKNGDVENEAHYTNGVINGRRIWSFPGVRTYVANYKDGKIDGKLVSYNPDGSISSVTYYKDGEQVPAPSTGDRRYSLPAEDVERKRRGLMEARETEVRPHAFVDDDKGKAHQKVRSWAEKVLPEPRIYQTEVGEVVIDQTSVSNSLAHGYNQAKLDAVATLPEGFTNAVYLGSLDDFGREATKNHYFAYPVRYNGERAYVFCRALKDRNSNRLYVHEVFFDDKLKKTDTFQTAASDFITSPTPHRGIRLYKEILSNILYGKDTENIGISSSDGRKKVQYSVTWDGERPERPERLEGEGVMAYGLRLGAALEAQRRWDRLHGGEPTREAWREAYGERPALPDRGDYDTNDAFHAAYNAAARAQRDYDVREARYLYGAAAREIERQMGEGMTTFLVRHMTNRDLRGIMRTLRTVSPERLPAAVREASGSPPDPPRGEGVQDACLASPPWGAGGLPDTQWLMEQLRESTKSLRTTALEDEAHRLRSENWHLRNDADAPEDAAERIEANTERLREIVPELEAERQRIESEGTRTVDDMMTKLQEKLERAAAGEDTWTQEDTRMETLLRAKALGYECERQRQAVAEAESQIADIDRQREVLRGATGDEADLKRERLRQTRRGLVDMLAEARKDYADALQQYAETLHGMVGEGRERLQDKVRRSMVDVPEDVRCLGAWSAGFIPALHA